MNQMLIKIRIFDEFNENYKDFIISVGSKVYSKHRYDKRTGVDLHVQKGFTTFKLTILSSK